MTKKNIRFIIGGFVVFVSAFILFVNFDDDKNFATAKSLDIFYSLFTEVTKNYIEDIDPEELLEIGISGMLSSLDPYTTFIPQADVERYKVTTRGEYGGVGAVIGSLDSLMIITTVLKNSPAHKAGLLPGDKIISVDGRSVIGKSYEDIHELLQGQPGTTLNMGVARAKNKKPITFSIQREKITIQSIPYFGMIDSTIGYIKLRSFTQNCAQDVKNALRSLQKQGAKSYVLDLRDNPGGLLFEAIQVTNIFIPKNQRIVYTRGRNSLASQDFLTQENPLDTTAKIAVLINEKSASAAEIVSGALQDLDRAIVIGSQTFGKGLVQTQKELTHDAMLKVTVSKYYIPSGRCIQKIDYSKHNRDSAVLDSTANIFYTKNKRPVKEKGGIIPDIIVESDTISAFQKELKNKYLFTNFVAHTFSYDDTMRFSAETFQFSDTLYNSFVNFCDANNFLYNSETMYLLNKLQKSSQKEHFKIKSEILELQENIISQQAFFFEDEKQAISRMLSLEIMQFLFFEEGTTAYFLPYDSSIITAKRYLHSPQLYHDILRGISGVHKK